MTLPFGSITPSSPVNISSYSPGERFGPRELVDYELVWMVTGSATWSVTEPGSAKRTKQLLTPGSVAFGVRGSDELYEWDPDTPTSHAWVHFAANAEAEAVLSERLASGVPRMRILSESRPLDALTDYLLALSRFESPDSRRRSDHFVGVFLDLMLDGPFLPIAPAGMPPVVERALDYTRREWRRDGCRILALSEIAAAVGVSAAHLSRQFGEAFPCGLIRALELVRLGRAALALQRSNLTVEEVGGEAGFSNSFYFSRRFSLTYGQPPGRYRRSPEVGDPLRPVTEAGLLPVWNRLVE